MTLLVPERLRLPSRAEWYQMDPAERVALAAASDGLIDRRVAEVGGYRTSRRDSYDFPSCREDSSWRRSDVHRATVYYGCSLCGQRFNGPHAVYTHLAKVHGR